MFFFQAMAKKIVALYQLANEQLSKQYHYDWGLRSLKAVIKLAAKMRHHRSEACESVILIQALHQINLSKLAFEDIPLFLGLIKVILCVSFRMALLTVRLHVVFTRFDSCSICGTRLNLNDMKTKHGNGV